MLPDDELRGMREAIGLTLPDLCNLGVLTYSVDTAGNSTIAFGTTVEDVPCRLDPMSAHEQMAGGAVQSFNRYKLTIPESETLTTKMQVEFEGDKYNVLGVLNGSWLAAARFIVEKVE